jgi:hypothetical protein
VTEDDDVLLAGLILVGSERPSECRFHLEHVEIRGGDTAAAYQHRLVDA